MENRRTKTQQMRSIFTARRSQGLEDIYESTEVTWKEVSGKTGGSQDKDGVWWTLTKITAVESGEIIRDYSGKLALLRDR